MRSGTLGGEWMDGEEDEDAQGLQKRPRADWADSLLKMAGFHERRRERHDALPSLGKALQPNLRFRMNQSTHGQLARFMAEIVRQVS